MMSNTIIDVDGDRAVAVSDYVLPTKVEGRLVPLITGRYRDELPRSGYRWQISRREASTMWQATGVIIDESTTAGRIEASPADDDPTTSIRTAHRGATIGPCTSKGALMETASFVDRHGVEVFTRCWPVDAARGVMLIAHGASEHSGRYDRFAQALNAAGFAVLALDHRGHGVTGSSTGPGLMGPGGGMAVIDDMDELRAAATSRFGRDAPIYVFGHSMGSLIAFGYLCAHSAGLAGAVLCGVPANIGETASLAELLQGFAEAGMRDEPASDLLRNDQSMFEPVRTPFDWLSRDAHEVDLYLADPFCGDANPLTYGYLIDLLGLIAPAGENMASIACPVLVIAGDHDPAGAMGAHPTDLARRLAAVGVETTLTLYEGARHEILNETDRNEVTADIIDWLRARAPETIF